MPDIVQLHERLHGLCRVSYNKTQETTGLTWRRLEQDGTMKKYSRHVFLALVFLATAVFAAGVPAVQRFLPAKDEIKGWSILPDSLQYGKGDDISRIYDGGYELYTKNGVIDAARQTYKHGDDYLEVTIHTMKSEKAATAFLEYWKKELKGTAKSKSIRGPNFLVTKPNVSRYFVTGKYFTTVIAFHSANKALGDTEQFMKLIDRKIRKS